MLKLDNFSNQFPFPWELQNIMVPFISLSKNSVTSLWHYRLHGRVDVWASYTIFVKNNFSKMFSGTDLAQLQL